MKKPLFIHLSSYENTDLIVNWILKKQFQSTYTLLDTEDSNRLASSSDLTHFLDQHPDLCAVSCAGIHLPFHQFSSEDSTTLPITALFFKNPLDRLFGIYEVDRRNLIGKQLSLHDYVESEVNSEAKKFEDAQANFIDQGDEADINALNVCGIMHLFNESIVVLEAELSRFFPHIDLSFYPPRYTSNKLISLTERLDFLHKEIGTDLFAFLVKNNQRDFDLIKLAETRLLQQLHALPDWEARLQNLESRCQALR